MTTTRTLLAVGAAGSFLAASALTVHAADPANPNPAQPLYLPGTTEPGGAVRDDAGLADRDADARKQDDARKQKDDRGWIEQVRDWWNSDQGEVKSVSGTIIDLETYLINGEEAARQQSSNAALYDSDPVALLTEDGDLYVLLDRHEQRMTRASFGDRGHDRDPAEAPVVDPALTGQSDGLVAYDRAASGQSMAADKPMAGDNQTRHLTAGQTLTISGNVYDRNGIKGLLVYGYTVESRFNQADRDGTERDGMDRAPDRANTAPGDSRDTGDRATPRPADDSGM